MAMEPISLFSRIADPAAVARRLRELVPTVEIVGPDDNWREAIVTFKEGSLLRKRKRTLTFTHDPEYYAEPGWSEQMEGMRGYFSQFGDTDRKDLAIWLTTTFKFSLGTLFDPDYDPDGDPRLEILFAIAEALDAVLFTPSSLRDANGRILFGAGGEDDEDPEAVWPKVVGELSVSDEMGAAIHERSRPMSADEAPDDLEPPTPQRVARRAVALTAVTARAILEQDAELSESVEMYGDLLNWIESLGIDNEFEPDEWAVLQRPLGRLDDRMLINSTWRLEGLAVLAWALGRSEMPPHDQLVECRPLWRSLGILDTDAAHQLLANPELRSRAEIAELRNWLFALHWRLRNFNSNREVLDFAGFARTCWFGPLDISGLPLIKGDLGIGGFRLDKAPDVEFSKAHSASRERHQAANWLWEGPELYSEASVDT